MSKVRCEQAECKYNNKSFCIKEGIYVDSCGDCASYRKGKLDRKYAFEIATFEDDEKAITCQAKNCVHNKDCKCKANCILVSKNFNKCKDYKSN